MTKIYRTTLSELKKVLKEQGKDYGPADHRSRYPLTADESEEILAAARTIRNLIDWGSITVDEEILCLRRAINVLKRHSKIR